ncbi:DNA-directed RNA polymerase subunit beta [Alkalihalobacillus sp. 1P02AB]|uniref:DNA-directed RNA polymerase subunit beta n=1 Tax=Alkalihalobacillus sp. 1P02AB TaxID=3132260 RepID=UPI0039A61AFF
MSEKDHKPMETDTTSKEESIEQVDSKQEELTEGTPAAKAESTNDEKQARETRFGRPKVKKGRIRLIPIWLRIPIVLALIGGCLILGLMFGYGTIGGQEPTDALKPETWYHILDLIRGNE